MASPINTSTQAPAPVPVGKPAQAVTDVAVERQVATAVGNSAPAEKVVREAPRQSAQDIAQATRDISDYIQTVNRSLQIAVDKDLGSTIITVLDSETDEIIRQIPQEEIVQIARFIEQQLADSASGQDAVRGLLMDSEG